MDDKKETKGMFEIREEAIRKLYHALSLVEPGTPEYKEIMTRLDQLEKIDCEHTKNTLTWGKERGEMKRAKIGLVAKILGLGAGIGYGIWTFGKGLQFEENGIFKSAIFRESRNKADKLLK